MDEAQQARDQELWNNWRREMRRARVIAWLVVLGGFGMVAFLFGVITGYIR